MLRRFLASGRTGFYFAVTQEGDVGAGDEIKVIVRDPNRVPVSEVTRLYIAKSYGHDEVSSIQRASRVKALPESWKAYFQQRLQEGGWRGGGELRSSVEVKGFFVSLDRITHRFPPRQSTSEEFYSQ